MPIDMDLLTSMQEGLEVTVGQRYSISCWRSSQHTYVGFELDGGPSLDQRRIHLSAITLTWGVIVFGMAFCGKWQTLAGLRAVPGFLEAGFFPGCGCLLRDDLMNFATRRKMEIDGQILLKRLERGSSWGEDGADKRLMIKPNDRRREMKMRSRLQRCASASCRIRNGQKRVIHRASDQLHNIVPRIFHMHRFLPGDVMQCISDLLAASRQDFLPDLFDIGSCNAKMPHAAARPV
jgi:hypothetical protein